MFALAELKSNVRIAPYKFGENVVKTITATLNKKLANKVILNVGLCIAVDEIKSIGHSHLIPCDGASHTDVIYRCIVFRPVIGSTLTGEIRNCCREGVYVSIGFFEDILIPTTGLQYPSRFDETEPAWIWEYPVDVDKKHDLYMDIGEPIIFRVFNEIFHEYPPNNATNEQGPSTSYREDTNTPYQIIGTISGCGLGLLSWWNTCENLQENENSNDDKDNDADNGESNEENECSNDENEKVNGKGEDALENSKEEGNDKDDGEDSTSESEETDSKNENANDEEVSSNSVSDFYTDSENEDDKIQDAAH